MSSMVDNWMRAVMWFVLVFCKGAVCCCVLLAMHMQHLLCENLVRRRMEKARKAMMQTTMSMMMAVRKPAGEGVCRGVTVSVKRKQACWAPKHALQLQLQQHGLWLESSVPCSTVCAVLSGLLLLLLLAMLHPCICAVAAAPDSSNDVSVRPA